MKSLQSVATLLTISFIISGASSAISAKSHAQDYRLVNPSLTPMRLNQGTAATGIVLRLPMTCEAQGYACPTGFTCAVEAARNDLALPTGQGGKTMYTCTPTTGADLCPTGYDLASFDSRTGAYECAPRRTDHACTSPGSPKPRYAPDQAGYGCELAG